jgi:hypothetical protein
MTPPGCCPEVRFTPVQPSVNLFISALFCCIPFSSPYFHISISCFLGNRPDGSSPEYFAPAKKSFHVMMRGCLIFSCKIQINVRLFVSFKSKKNFERYLVTFFTITLPHRGQSASGKSTPDSTSPSVKNCEC